MFVHPQIKLNIGNLKLFFRKFSEAGLKEKLVKIFPDYHIVFTDSGRSAFQLAIQSLNLENSEMLIPAYICDIFEPILKHYNIKPIYLDIDLKTFHANLDNVESKITAKTKSILICHTYGLPAEMNKILEIAKKYNLKIIEDCAHLHLFGLPRTESRGNCAFFSFAKLFPTIDGGMLVSKNPIGFKLENYKFKLSNLIKFARLFPSLANLSEIFRKEEKTLATNEFTLPRKASKISLKIFDFYLKNLEELIQKRIKLAEYFQKKLIEIGFGMQESKNNTFTFLSALVPKNLDRDELFNKLNKKHIFCSRIWHKPIYPNLPNTAEAAKRIINFPLQNWFKEKDIDRIIAGILSKKD
jgi:dTDP-4-amino-4,6-dideoxygalactose transaminase